MNHKEIAKRLNDTIKDVKLKTLLFDSEDIEDFEIQGIDTIYKVLTFIFVFIYIQYKYRKLNNLPMSNSQNAKRVYAALDNIYCTENIERSLMFYVVKEALIDEDKNMRKSDFANVVNSHDGINKIIEIDNIIKVWLASNKAAEGNLQKLAELLDYLITTFKGLQYIKINQEDNGYVNFKFERDEIEYPSYGIIRVIDNELYYLYEYVNVGNMTNASYKRFGSESIRIEQINKKEFQEDLQYRKPEHPSKILIKNTFPREYAYLNNLSLAISETLTEDNKQDLFYQYRDNNPYIFSMDNKIDIRSIYYSEANIDNWDEIISMLILEESPTKLMRSVLESHGFNFEELVENLSIRYGDRTIYNEVLPKAREYEIKERENAARFNVQITSDKNLFDKIKIDCKIKCIMECLAKKEKLKYGGFENEFAGTIELIRERILDIENSNDSVKSKTLDINFYLEGIFRYLLVFYRAVIAFGEKKLDLLCDVSVDNDVNADYNYNECVKAFFNAVEKYKKEYSTLSFGKLIDATRSFSKELYDRKNINVGELSNESKALHEVIGRYNFIDIDTLHTILKITTEENKEFCPNGKNPIENIVTYINVAKHNKPNYPKLTEKSFTIFSNHINTLIDYLIKGSDYDRSENKNNKSSVSTRPIYPYVAYYSYSLNNRDGIKIPQFSVSVTTKSERKIKRKILSGINYDTSLKYYCLPNNSTSNEYWWIEPFLIDSKKFDENMYDNFNNNAKDQDDSGFSLDE